MFKCVLFSNRTREYLFMLLILCIESIIEKKFADDYQTVGKKIIGFEKSLSGKINKTKVIWG